MSEERIMKYQDWFDDVRNALRSINMPMDDWQKLWPFNFISEYEAGSQPADAAAKANRHWWHEQNKSSTASGWSTWIGMTEPSSCRIVRRKKEDERCR